MSKNPIALSESEIINKIDYLESHLPTNPTASDSFFRLQNKYHKLFHLTRFSQSVLNELSVQICTFLGIKGIVKVHLAKRTLNPLCVITNEGKRYKIKSSDVTGLCLTSGRDYGEIIIIINPMYNLRRYLAILTHEIIHHYLNQNEIRKDNEQDNELLTEIAAAYLGVGIFLVNGYKPITWTTVTPMIINSVRTTHTIRTGYVTPETIRKAIVLTAIRRGWNLKEVVRSFSSLFDKLMAYIRLYHYIKKSKIVEYKRDNADEKKCPFCKSILNKDETDCPVCNRVLIERIYSPKRTISKNTENRNNPK